MRTVLSSKGQIVLNAALRRSLGLAPGAIFSIKEHDGKIILEQVAEGKPRGVLVRDPESGRTVLKVSQAAPLLTSQRVKDLLANFP